MEAYLSAAGRAEAHRWIGIAAKLLAARDLVGSKSFALRAQESDPNSQPAAQILAVVDTLFAGKKRINNQQDLYTILQLPHSTHDWEIIAANYRRLALLLNPHMNNFPSADQAFRFVLEAWSILSNPSRKSVYDSEINFQPTFKSIPEQLPPDMHQNQQAQFQDETLNQNPRNGVETENVVEESEVHNADDFSDDESLTFWTACPYCYNLYEYTRVYVECCLRCQNCRRAFQAVEVTLPRQIDFDNKEPVFSCFGFFPIVVSLKNSGGAASNWCPFSQIVASPPPIKNAENVEHVENANAETGKKPTGRKSTGPVVYIDDDDDPEVLNKMSDSGDDNSSDGDWRKSSYVLKKVKSVEKSVSSGRRGRPPKKSNVNVGVARNLRSGSRLDNSEPSKIVASSNVRRQVGKTTKKNLGELDLNVELSNEVEDPNGGGRKEDENIEGIGFFEGLDEFLSNLPILSEDKVKEVA